MRDFCYHFYMAEQNRDRFSMWLDKMDEKAANKGKGTKVLWQIVKFIIVGLLVTLIQLGLVNLLYFLMKNWIEPLPGFIGLVFSENVMGIGHSNWGYILPFFLSNLIANTVGYFLNKHKTFKSDSPWYHYVIYIVVLFLLIVFTTWVQGLIANAFINVGVESIGPTIAAMAAGTIQMILLFPLQKFVLLREKKDKSFYRKASLDDLEQVMEAVEDSREVLRLQGNGQWQDGYPNRDDFIKDINNGRLFVICDKDKLIGVCALTYREEDYHHLYEGKWLTDLPYMVMHRVALKKEYRGLGYGKKLFEVFIAQAKLEGYKSLRIDTHEGNMVMRHLIESFGFVYCGKAILTPDKDRMVFEKIID